MAKDLYPGKRNNLDVLCERYEVDNSRRTLHGALLDAELLAEVYLAMTRGQDSLLMELETCPRSIPSRAWAICIWSCLPPTAEELEAHTRQLEMIETESKGKCLWRQLELVETANATLAEQRMEVEAGPRLIPRCWNASRGPSSIQEIRPITLRVRLDAVPGIKGPDLVWCGTFRSPYPLRVIALANARRSILRKI